MTLLQTIKRGVKKALANGYVPMPGYNVVRFDVKVNKAGFGFVAFLVEKPMARGENKQFEVTFSIADILFDLGFAKAIWGEDKQLTEAEAKDAGIKHWGGLGGGIWTLGAKYHEREMVILETNWERITYLGSNL